MKTERGDNEDELKWPVGWASLLNWLVLFSIIDLIPNQNHMASSQNVL